MDVTPLIAAGRQMIEAYGDGGFRIAGMRHQGSVIVLPERTLAWGVADFAALTLDALAPLLDTENRPSLLLLGCGPSLVLVPRGLRAEMKAQGIVCEPMDTGAACRTFNVLLGEGRPVAAALIAV